MCKSVTSYLHPEKVADWEMKSQLLKLVHFAFLLCSKAGLEREKLLPPEGGGTCEMEILVFKALRVVALFQTLTW